MSTEWTLPWGICCLFTPRQPQPHIQKVNTQHTKILQSLLLKETSSNLPCPHTVSTHTQIEPCSLLSTHNSSSHLGNLSLILTFVANFTLCFTVICTGGFFKCVSVFCFFFLISRLALQWEVSQLSHTISKWQSPECKLYFLAFPSLVGFPQWTNDGSTILCTHTHTHMGVRITMTRVET